MAKQPDGAFLFWARDWLTNENVVLMSPAAKGVYVDLLCHCWLEGSIPACSEHLQRIARLDAQTFAAIWSELCGRFAPHPTEAGRLINRRMDEERERAEERRKLRSDKAAKAAQARWSTAPRNPRRTAPRNAPSIANASPQAMLADAHQSKPSTTPLPPESGGERAVARGASSEPERERASRAGSEPGNGASSRHRDDGASPIADLTSALMATRYRAGIGNAIARRGAIREQAERLVQTGLQPNQVRELSDLAAQKSSDDPGALLSHWLDGDWRGVLDEQDAKGRQKAARSRGAAQAPDDGATADRLAYGESGAPRNAGSVLGDVLATVRTA